MGGFNALSPSLTMLVAVLALLIVALRVDALDAGASASEFVTRADDAGADEGDLSRRTIPIIPRHVRLSLTNSVTGMLVSWHTDQPVKRCRVQYTNILAAGGVLAGPLERDGVSSSYNGASVHIHRVLLPDLLPNSVYRYRVGDGRTWSDTFTFKTRSTLPSEVKISVWGDQGVWGGAVDFQRLMQNDMNSELALHLGDLCYGTNETTWNSWGDLVQPVTSRLPYMVLPGNWDVMDHSKTLFYHRFHNLIIANRATDLLQTALSASTINPGNGFYYSFDYQAVHFVMMDSYIDYAAGSAQYAWLEFDLGRANRNRAAVPFVIVCFHSPMYSSSAGHDGGDKPFQKAIEPLLVEHDVDLCLSGHDHGYERSFPIYRHVVSSSERQSYSPLNKRHPIHLLVGIGGATQDPWHAQPAWSAYRESMIGVVNLYARAEPAPLLTVRVERANGTIADTFRLQRPILTTQYSTLSVQLAVVGFLVLGLLALWPMMRRRVCVGKQSLCHFPPKSGNGCHV